MKKYMLLLNSASFLFLLLSCGEDPLSTEDPRGTLTGRIIDFYTGEPLSNASVYTSPASEAIYTDASGAFKFENIGVGEYSVYAKKDGYYTESIPIKVFTGKTTTAILPLRSELSDNHVPEVPELLFPGNELRLSSKSVVLSWACSDEDNDELTFDVYLSTLSQPATIIAESIDKLEFIPKSLKDSTTYYWKVIARDEHGAISESDIHSFTTDSSEQEVNKEDLILYINFENGQIADKSPKAHSITNLNVMLSEKEKRNCGQFSSTAHSILRMPGEHFDTQGVFTAACRVSIESNYGNGSNNLVDILSRFGGAGVRAASWNLAINSERKLASQSYNGTTIGLIESPNTLKQDKWCHIALVRNKQNAKLFIDGELVMEHNGIEPQGSNFEFCVGGRNDNNSYFQGYIDDVVFYSRTLSDNAIKSLAK